MPDPILEPPTKPDGLPDGLPDRAPLSPPLQQPESKEGPFAVGEGGARPSPMIDLQQSLGTVPTPKDWGDYPFKQRMPYWFMRGLQELGGNAPEPRKLTKEEAAQWKKYIPQGMTLDEGLAQIYHEEFLEWSRDYKTFRETGGNFSRVDHAKLFDLTVRTTINSEPDHPMHDLRADKAGYEAEYLKNTGKTYAEVGKELFMERWVELQNAYTKPNSPHFGLGYVTKRVEDDPNKRRFSYLMDVADERTFQTFADPKFDFGAVGPDGKKLLTAKDIMAIVSKKVRTEVIESVPDGKGGFTYKRHGVEMIPALKEIAPEQWEKLMDEVVSERLGMPTLGADSRKAADLWMGIRGAIPFGSKVRPLTEEEEYLLMAAAPNHETAEIVGGMMGLFTGSYGSFKAFDKIRKAGKTKTAYATLLGMEGALGAAYSHSVPGYFSDLAGKPDSYLLNAAEAAAISGLFQLGFWGFSRLKGQRAAVTAQEIEELQNPNLDFAQRSAIIERAKKKLENSELPDPSKVKPVADEDVLAVGSPTRLQRSRNWFKRTFFSSQGLPEEWAYWKTAAEGAKAEKTMGIMSRDLESLRDMFNKHHGRDPNGHDLDDLNRTLEHGRVNDLHMWPDDIRGKLIQLRKHRQELSAAFRESVPGLSESLRQTIDYNMRNYMHRSYRLHEEREAWVKKLLPKGGGLPKDPKARLIYDDAFNFIHRTFEKDLIKKHKLTTGQAPSKSELDQMVHNEIHNFLKQDEAGDLFAIQQLGNVDSKIITDIIRRRKDIPLEVRRLMGEYKNPFANYELTISKMAQHMEMAKMYSNFRAHGLQNGLVYSDVAVRPTVQDIRVRQQTLEGHGTLGGPISGSANYGQGADQMRFFVTIPPSTADGLPQTRYFASRKAATEFRDKEWAKIPSIHGSPREAAGYVQVPNSPKYVALAGHHVREDLYHAVMELDDLVRLRSAKSPALTALGTAWKVGVTGVNMSKTVYSHVTQVRNIVGGYMINAANGRFWYKDGVSSAGKLLDDMKHLKDADKAKEVDEWRELNLLGGDINMRHMELALEDANLRKWLNAPPDEAASLMRKWSEEIARGVIKKPMEFYQGVDSFFRVAAYQNELRKLTKAFEGWDGTPKGWTPDTKMPKGFYGPNQVAEMNLKQYAAELTNNTYQNYDRLSKAVQNVRIAPFGNFVSFQAEMYRTSKNTIKQAMGYYDHSAGKWVGGELSHPNPAVRKMGAKRIAAFMGVGVVGSWGAKEGANYLFAKGRGHEMNNEVEEAMLHFLPDYQRNNEIVVTDLKNGRFEFVDATYNNPFGFINKTARAAFMAGGWKDRDHGDAFKEMISSLGDEKILLQSLSEANSGQTDYGTDVWLETDSDSEKFSKSLAHVASSAYKPGSVQSIERLLDVAKEKRDGNWKYELAAQFTGMRHYTINLMDAKSSPLKRKGAGYDAYKSDANRILYQTLIQPSNLKNQDVSVEDQVNAYREANRRLFEGQQRLFETMKAAKVLGLDEDQIFNQLNSDLSRPSSRRVSLPEWVGRHGRKFDGISNGVFVPLDIPNLAGMMEKAGRRDTKIATKELEAIFEKYTKAKLSLEGRWTDDPLPRDKRR